MHERFKAKEIVFGVWVELFSLVRKVKTQEKISRMKAYAPLYEQKTTKKNVFRILAYFFFSSFFFVCVCVCFICLFLFACLFDVVVEGGGGFYLFVVCLFVVV